LEIIITRPGSASGCTYFLINHINKRDIILISHFPKRLSGALINLLNCTLQEVEVV
jgi:hypothetical protein